MDNLLSVPLVKDITPHIYHAKTKLTIATWNCRSVNNKSNFISETISSQNIDILCLSETWLRADSQNGTVITDLLPPGFKNTT